MDIKKVVEGVHAITGGAPVLGSLKLTDYHIIFTAQPQSSTTTNQTSNSPSRPKESWITYPIISQCVFRPTPPASSSPSSIRLRCRDFSFVTFNFKDMQGAREVFEAIRNRTCRLGGIDKLYAFKYGPARQERGLNGWGLYDPRAEFRRQGISSKSTDKGWRVSTINHDYEFSPTYPALLVVPTKISDNVLKYAGQFRSRARIPCLTYYHPVTGCAITRSSQPLVGLKGNRSIQDERLVGACFYPSTDFMSISQGTIANPSPSSSQLDLAAPTEQPDLDPADEELIAAPEIIYDEKTGNRLIGARRDNLIVDARPAINSYAMQFIGKGSENMDNYPSAKKVFLNIENIHKMRSSLHKVIDAVKDADMTPFPPNRELLAKSNWLTHIQGILNGSQVIARQVGIHAAHVLIHCSDGWDRTSQLSALSQIMLDPYYRTIDGFIVLVEKDWLSFGHMFQQRSGHLSHEDWFTVQNDAMAGTRIEPGENDSRSDDFLSDRYEATVAIGKRLFRKQADQEKDESDGETPATEAPEENLKTATREISPVFHQFLDATYQLLRQHPTRFEFTERFLRRLFYHLHSCQYGTFLYNNEKQRQAAKVSERTSSVWNYFLCRRQEFTNPEYDATVDESIRGKERLLFPKLNDIRWWHQLFNRSDEDMNASLNAASAAAAKAAAYQKSSVSSGLLPPRQAVSTENSQPGSPRRSSSTHQTPGLQSSQSVITGVETAHALLTPGTPPPSLTRSASAGENGALSAIRDGFAGLGIGQRVGGVLGSFSSNNGSSSSHNAEGPHHIETGSSGPAEQEMKAVSWWNNLCSTWPTLSAIDSLPSPKLCKRHYPIQNQRRVSPSLKATWSS